MRMDLKPRTPLPPGMVPSGSRQDLNDVFEQEEKIKDEEKKSIIQERSVKDSESTQSISTSEVIETAVISETPTVAWKSPSDATIPSPSLDTYQIDLSEHESESMDSEIKRVPVKNVSTPERNKTPRRKLWSPFSRSKDQPQDLREEVLSQGKKFSKSSPTTKGPLSPLKKHNKVVPSPSKPQSSLTGRLHVTSQSVRQDNSLQSTSESLLESPAKVSNQKIKDDRPTSAPSKKKNQHQLQDSHAPSKKKNQHQLQDSHQLEVSPFVPSVIVKSKEKEHMLEHKQTGPSTPSEGQTASVVDVEALYSTVVKSKPKMKTTSQPKMQGEDSEKSDLIMELPKLDTYEPPHTVLDTSLVFTNSNVPDSLSEVSHSEPQTDQVDYTPSYDPVYDTVQETALDVADMPVYNASVYKGLKKHEENGNVQLIYVKDTAPDILKSHTMNFPEGSSMDMSPLHYAAASGDKKLLEQVLSILPVTQDPVEMVLGTEKMCTREGLEVCDSEGRTPIMHAVHNNHVESVKKLAEVGANVNTVANDGSTCLHQAAYSGSIDMVALLLGLGADGLNKDNEGRTPLHWCTNNNKPKSIEIILDKVPGLDVDARDGAMMTPLMWASFHGHQDHVIKLIERGAVPHLTDIDGMTAAHWAIQRQDTRTLQILINTESASYQDNKGKTVMHQAAERGSAKAVSLIKAVKPTSVNDQDDHGRTPLHWATVCENPEVIRALLTHGANPSVKDDSGCTALDYATVRGLHYCALLLSQSSGFDETDNYHSIPTYGGSSAAYGSRALQKQEGHDLFSSGEDIRRVLTQEQILQIQTVCRGSWMNKHSNTGKGPLHPRFVWVNPSNLKICWSKEKDASNKDAKSDILVGVRSSASSAVIGRKDFDPMNKHKYAFTIFTSSRVLDMVALSSNDYKIWLEGLQVVLRLGSVNVIRLLSIIQSTAGEDQRPIP